MIVNDLLWDEVEQQFPGALTALVAMGLPTVQHQCPVQGLPDAYFRTQRTDDSFVLSAFYAKPNRFFTWDGREWHEKDPGPKLHPVVERRRQGRGIAL